MGNPDVSKTLLDFTNNRHSYGQYIVGEWNLCGWKSAKNPYYVEYKRNVISCLYFDFLILPETHCMNDESIMLENYIVYNNNRRPIGNNNTRGSGGIAIAVNKNILKDHIVINVTKGIDGQISLKCKNIYNEFTVGILGLYLPPETYIYGKDPEAFFNEASVLFEELSDCDMRIGGGDLNARTREIEDFISDVDGNLIPARTNPDKCKNSHADSYIPFLKDNRSVILNGRITPSFNNFTFISTTLFFFIRNQPHGG